MSTLVWLRTARPVSFRVSHNLCPRAAPSVGLLLSLPPSIAGTSQETGVGAGSGGGWPQWECR
jgi:hypothetical protein